jgi:hypothetical protein
VAFIKGQGGRPRGARNKRTIEFMEVLEKRDFCPATALIECFLEAKKNYESCQDPLDEVAHRYLRIAADIAKDLTSYAYPKLKSIEQKIETDPEQDRPLADLSDEELDSL